LNRRALHPGSAVIRLVLATLLPHLDSEEFAVWSVPTAERILRQRELASRSDALVDQLLVHGTLVLSVPM